MTPKGRVFANLSRYHPDYGMTPAEHFEQKKQRAAGKVKFVSKDALRHQANAARTSRRRRA